MGARSTQDLGYRAWRAFHRMRIALLPPLVRHLSESSGLSEADYQVFIGLTSADGGQLKPTELARDLGWDMSRLSHQVTRMEARGLVSRHPCPVDARSCWLGLTRKGRALAAAAIPAQAKEVERLFTAALTRDQLQSLIDIAAAIEAHVAALDAAHGLPADAGLARAPRDPALGSLAR